MAEPKKKLSKTRRGNRRSHQKLSVPSISVCAFCKKKKLNHFECKHCSKYSVKQKTNVG